MKTRAMKVYGWPLLCLLIFGVAAACVTSAKRIELTLAPLSPEVKVPRSLEQQRNDLNQVLSKNDSDSAILKDVQDILEAQVLEEKGDFPGALVAWRSALSKSTGVFGEKAVAGWIKAYCRSLGKKYDRPTLAKLVLTETQGGNVSPWMVERELGSDAKLEIYLSQTVPDAIEGDLAASGASIVAPSRLGVPAGDPLLTSTAQEVCKFKSRFGSGWSEWRAALSKDINLYFDGLVAQCSGQPAKAAEMLLDAAAKLAAHEATAHMGLEAYARVIKIRRDGGERESVAPLFMPLARLWKSENLNESALGLSRQAFELRRIEDMLSAARHRALINDVESAKIFANDAINFASIAQSQTWSFNPEIKSLIAGQIAEAYHLMAFRLAVEARDFTRAVSLSKMALQTTGLNSEWEQRLQWSSGLYQYMANNCEEARRIWEQMLSDRTDEAYRPMLLFWISRCHAKLGNSSESDFYRKTLAQDHPLSFYAVVAMQQTGSSFNDVWTLPFKDIEGMKKTLSNWDQDSLDSLRGNPVKARLLRRSELLIAAKTDQFSLAALDELQKTIDTQSTSEADQKAALYVSRLYASAGYWMSTQALTTKISRQAQFWEKYPEQLLVYFPRPWTDLYKKIAGEVGVDPETLMAVTRQESGFRADVRSPANAYGLMQFTPPTARRIGQTSGTELKSIPESLLNPETNIRLGAHYLKLLKAHFGGFKNQSFAAYNAGEQAVDSWVTRRTFDDPLLFIELIPYMETRTYVKNVWRNESVYAYLQGTPSH